MKNMTRFPTFILCIILLAGCTHSLEDVFFNSPSNTQQLAEIQAMSVDDWENPTWHQINRGTNVLMNNMGDVITDINKDEVEKIARAYFVDDMKIKKSRLEAVQGVSFGKARSDINRRHMNLRMLLANNTRKHAKDLLDRKGYKQFNKALDPFLPKVITRGDRYNDPGDDWNWLSPNDNASDSGSYGSMHGEY